MAAVDERKGPRLDELQRFTPFVAIVAVVVGFGLGQLDAWRRGRREARGARTLLRLEIGDNIEEVRRYRGEAADRALEEMLPPAWQKEAWASQLARLPSALDVPELARVRRFYSRLDLIAEHHQRARNAANHPVVQTREVEAADRLTRALMAEGNPLSPRHRDARRRFLGLRPRSVRRWLTSGPSRVRRAWANRAPAAARERAERAPTAPGQGASD